jgi:hypothetical protein
MADADYWFTYYFWLDDAKAPDYARVVDIFRKPGYDPVEMFMTSRFRAAYKLLRKKAGLRYVMDVIPLDAGLIKGSHGRIGEDRIYHPVLISDRPSDRMVPFSGPAESKSILATDVYSVIWDALTR